MKKLLSLLLTLMLILSLLTGCSKNETTTDNKADTTVSGDSTTIIFTDDLGRTVEIEGPITKIVPSGPLSQIMLFAIAPDMFVGVSSDWDEAAATYLNDEYYNLPVIGQLYGGKGEVNLE